MLSVIDWFLGMIFDEALYRVINQLFIQSLSGFCSTGRNWRSVHTLLVTLWKWTFLRTLWLTPRLQNSMNRWVFLTCVNRLTTVDSRRLVFIIDHKLVKITINLAYGRHSFGLELFGPEKEVHIVCEKN